MSHFAGLRSPPLPPSAAPQPYGLSNVQSRAAAPLLTESWASFCSWHEATARRILGIDVFRAGESEPRPMIASYGDIRVALLSEAGGIEKVEDSLLRTQPPEEIAACITWQDNVSQEDRINRFFEIADGNDAAIGAVMSATTAAGSFSVDRTELTVEAGLSAEAAQLAAEITTPPIVWLPFTDTAGFAIERAVSLAICGAEVLHGAVVEHFLTMLDSDDLLGRCLAMVGLPSADVVAFRAKHSATFGNGARLAPAAEAVKIAMAHLLLKRRILMVSDPKEHAFLFDSDDESRQLPAVVLARHWLGYPFVASAAADSPLFGMGSTVRFAGQGILPSSRIAALCGSSSAVKTTLAANSTVNLSGTVPAHLAFPSVVGLRRHVASRGVQFLFEQYPATYFALDVPQLMQSHLDIPVEFITANLHSAALLASPGFGQDAAARRYLGTNLMAGLEPLVADADGHCLFHAISRCLTGKPYLWHALRTALFEYMAARQDALSDFFKANEFLSGLVEELPDLIARVSPDSEATRAATATGRGMGTEHVFALANLLRRPILLLDGPDCRDPQGSLFLPLLDSGAVAATRCALVIGWWSAEHGHFVPVVPGTAGTRVVLSVANLPTNSTTGNPLIYGVADGNSRDTLRRFLESPSDSDISIVVGGNAPDVLSAHMANHLAAAFAQRHGVSIWAIEMCARALEDSDAVDAATAFAAFDGTRLVSEALRVVREDKLRLCKHCGHIGEPFGATLDTCRKCYRFPLLRQGIDRSKGVFDLTSGARTWFPAANGSNDTGFKRWVGVGTQLTLGDIIMARDHGSNLSVAHVDAVYVDVISGGVVADVTFLADTTNISSRFAVPMSDVMVGYAVDNFKLLRFSECGTLITCPVVSDEISRLSTTAESIFSSFASTPAGRKALLSQRYQGPMVRERVIANIQEYINETLEDWRYEATFSSIIHRERTAMQFQTDDGTGLQQPSTLPVRERIYVDDDGCEVGWESRDPMSYEWVAYDRDASGDLEAAFRAGEKLQSVSIGGFGNFTVVFNSMEQKNSVGGSRAVRRVKHRGFECASCTFQNLNGRRPRCEMCDTARSDDYPVVLRDALMALEERQTRLYVDPTFAEGGQMFAQAQGREAVQFGDQVFVLVPSLKRYLPIEHPVYERNPLFGVIDRLLTETGNLLVTLGGFRFIRNSEPGARKSVVCSQAGMKLGMAHFYDFVRHDVTLREGGELFAQCAAQSSHLGETTLPAYGGKVSFALSARSAMGPLYVPVLSKTKPDYPLYQDLSHAALTQRAHVRAFAYHGWEFAQDADGVFHAEKRLSAAPRDQRLVSRHFSPSSEIGLFHLLM